MLKENELLELKDGSYITPSAVVLVKIDDTAVLEGCTHTAILHLESGHQHAVEYSSKELAEKEMKKVVKAKNGSVNFEELGGI